MTVVVHPGFVAVFTRPAAGSETGCKRQVLGLVIVSLGYMMKVYTPLPPMAMYLILTVAVFTLSPLIYETVRRIPFVRWCVLGDSKR